jgi:hypothetical protein
MTDLNNGSTEKTIDYNRKDKLQQDLMLKDYEVDNLEAKFSEQSSTEDKLQLMFDVLELKRKREDIRDDLIMSSSSLSTPYDF